MSSSYYSDDNGSRRTSPRTRRRSSRRRKQSSLTDDTASPSSSSSPSSSKQESSRSSSSSSSDNAITTTTTTTTDFNTTITTSSSSPSPCPSTSDAAAKAKATAKAGGVPAAVTPPPAPPATTSSTSTPSTTTKSNNNNNNNNHDDHYVGCHVSKLFEIPNDGTGTRRERSANNKKSKYYGGTVTSYDDETELFSVCYDEDDDREQVGIGELKSILIRDNDNNDNNSENRNGNDENEKDNNVAVPSSPKRTTRSSPRKRKQISYKEIEDDGDEEECDGKDPVNNDDRDEDDDNNDIISYVSEAEEEEEEDGENIVTLQAPTKKKRRGGTPSKTTATATTTTTETATKKSTTTTKARTKTTTTTAAKITNTINRKRKSSAQPATTTKEDNGHTISPNSIAIRGLPRGSRAIGKYRNDNNEEEYGVLEIRTLDGISPLLTPTVIQRAIQFVLKGQYQEAAKLACLSDQQHSSNIRTFLTMACEKLDMEPPIGIISSSSSTSDHSNTAATKLSQRALQRLEEGTVPIDSDLPGRLLVVRATTGTNDNNDGKEIEGCVFESAAELHTALKGQRRVATFANMHVTQETAFSPYDIIIQRMETAGLLLPSPEEEGEEDLDSSTDDGHRFHDNNKKRPFVVRIAWYDASELPLVSWDMYDHHDTMMMKKMKNDDDEMQWALLEGATRDAPPVILGVSSNLIVEKSCSNTRANHKNVGTIASSDNDNNNHKKPQCSGNKGGICSPVLPLLSPEVGQIRLPASLLQKAIRRDFCSAAPLLEACHALLYGSTLKDVLSDDVSCYKKDADASAPRGGTFAMLSTIWRCMLEDASPFAPPDDGSLLGVEELLALSLVAKADDSWQLPPSLLHKVVATAIRTQQQPANLSNVEMSPDQSDVVWKLNEMKEEDDDPGEVRACNLNNGLLVMRAALGVRTVHRTSLETTTPILKHEDDIVKLFMQGLPQSYLPMDTRLQHLDNECRLAAYDTNVVPSSLLLLQAALPTPPKSWKKYSLPAISRQVRKLITDVNARMPDHHRLLRLSAWGYNNSANTDSLGNNKDCLSKAPARKKYMSAREIATTTGQLSEKEHEIIDCFETVQRWRQQQQQRKKMSNEQNDSSDSDISDGKFIRAQVGAPPKLHDGRMAFLLAFARAEEIEVCPEEGKPEVVNVLFCGDPTEPLLVQRIGKARREAEAVVEKGSSGAKAVPSLGYVQRSRSKTDRLLIEAAERQVAKIWKGGRTMALPLPPPGFQWNLPSEAGQEEAAEQAVNLNAKFIKPGKWQFSIGGVNVEAFDARKVISPCSLDTHNHEPVSLGPEREKLIRLALYSNGNVGSSPKAVLQTLASLHEMAVDNRKCGANEGMVYDWLPLATGGKLTAPIWRDAILALKTREREDVILGPVLPDGTNKRDMTEGCVLRIYYVLENLYPTVLIKSGALKWHVRQRGAGYHHMLGCLELLSRGAACDSLVKKEAHKVATKISKPVSKGGNKSTGARKHLLRRAAKACESAVASLASDEGENDVIEDDYKDTGSMTEGCDDDDCLALPKVTTTLWPHQEASVAKVVDGVREGRRGHADASAVGAGKTLTALATVVRLAAYMKENHGKRNGVLVMLPTKALMKEWLLQIAEHTTGFHVVEQREDGQLFSLTYGRSGAPIDGNTIVISTLDRVREHPFKHQSAWDFVVIDECLAIQNADAKRCPSAWRQIEVSTLGVLMLSATFFRSKYSDLFYMIRMLRTAFPRSMEWLSATIHEHIVCQVPETDRTWQMHGKPVALDPSDLKHYRSIIEAYKRKQLNNSRGSHDYRHLFTDLEAVVRTKYEGRLNKTMYAKTSKMAEACLQACKELLKQGHRPLVFADTQHEADHFMGVLNAGGLNARKWSNVARDNVSGKTSKAGKKDVIIGVKSIEGQGINMQGHADAIVCRPTPGDHLEQMKGRIDRPGQTSKNLVLVVLMAEHTIEEAKFANIHLAGNFFREYIAPVATRYRERIDLEATLAAGGTAKLRSGTVIGTWRRRLEEAGQSGAFASISRNPPLAPSPKGRHDESEEVGIPSKRRRGNDGLATKTTNEGTEPKPSQKDTGKKEKMPAALNKVLRNKGDPVAVREAKAKAQNGLASLAIREWLFPPKQLKKKNTGLPLKSLLRFSDAKPPAVMDPPTVRNAVKHLSKDKKLAALIARVGADALIADCGVPKQPTDGSLFDNIVRGITFTMVSVDAGNAFIRRLAIKVGVCIEQIKPANKRKATQEKILEEVQEGGGRFDSWDITTLMEKLLGGQNGDIKFTPTMLSTLAKTCRVIDGQLTGYPHLCGPSHPCGKHDDPADFLAKAREHEYWKKYTEMPTTVSAGFSKPKADFLLSLVNDFESGKISAKKIVKASDREAMKMLMDLKGLGDWSAGQVIMHNLKRADIMLYGDLTVRNYLNDLYDINHNENSATELESAADFPDTAENRNLIDKVAEENNWAPYRTVVCLLMYHLQEESLVLL